MLIAMGWPQDETVRQKTRKARDRMSAYNVYPGADEA